MTTDLSRSENCASLVQTAYAWQGKVDVWVNNAGVDVLTSGLKHRDFESKLLALLQVDLLATIRLSRAVADRMVHQAGGVRADCMPCIINVGWDQAYLGMEGEPGQMFATTKAAVMSFTQSLALTVGETVRVNCVAPGWIKTAWGKSDASQYWERRANSECLQQRWGVAEDVARTVWWLASEEAQFVNGQIINVNGGRRYYPH